MEVKKGYKQTEVGVIPEDWEVKLAGDICRVNQGLQIPISNRHKTISLKSKIYITIQYLNERKDIEYIDIYSSSVCCNVNDILMTRTGNTGIVITNVDGVFHNNFFKINYDKKILLKQYLVNYLNKKQIQHLILVKAGASTIPDLNHKDFYSIPIVIPTLAEQQAIAEALSDADALIESLEQLIAKKRNIKQGAMQELLTGKRRLPGFSGEWGVKTLGEVADIRSGGTPSTNNQDFWDGDILWCTPTDITGLKGFKFIENTTRTITTQGLKCSSAELIPSYSVVMTSRATIGECAINILPVATNQGFKNFIPFQNTDIEFLYYLLQTNKQDFISLCGGSTFLEIGKTQLTGFEIELPKDKTEQTAIATILSDMDTGIAELEVKLEKARQIKQGMMQELLTGRIRLV